MPFQIDRSRLESELADYFEITNEIETLEDIQKGHKKEILEIMQESGIVHHEVKGLGSMRITPPGTRESYDTAAIDALILELIGQKTDITDAFARKLLYCKKVTQVQSFLRIEREKAGAKRSKTS